MSKRPIDIKREAAFSMTIGSDAEGGIKEMLPVGGRLYTIKENAIYAIDMADQIDPGRTNLDIPHVAQKIYPVGDKSELVGRIILQAKFLFGKGGMLDQKYDRDALLAEAFSFFDEIYHLAKILEEFRSEQNKIMREYTEAEQDGESLQLPAIMGMEGRAKSFVQKAEHSTQCLFRMCQQYAELTPGKSGWFDGFVNAVKEQDELDAEGLERLGYVTRFAKFIRNCRHCVEHPKVHQKIVASDFRLNPAGQIELPSIEIIHGETPEPKIGFVQFMEQAIESLTRAYVELCGILAFLMRSEGWKNSVGIAVISEERRRHPFVEIYYVMNMGGILQPIG